MLKEIFKHPQGFTLIEVLVSMVIMSTGLLGLAMLQGRALTTNQDAYLYGQANLLAYEMSDRIKANKAFWGSVVNATTGSPCVPVPPPGASPAGYLAYSTTGYVVGGLCSTVIPVIASTAPTPNCSSSATPCNPTQMATYDLYRWQQDVTNLLSATASVSIQRITAMTGVIPLNCTFSAPDATSLCISITWATKSPNANGSVGTSTQDLGMTP